MFMQKHHVTPRQCIAMYTPVSRTQRPSRSEVSLTPTQVAFVMIMTCSAFVEGVAPLQNMSHAGVGVLFLSGVVAVGASMAALAVISTVGAVKSSMLSVVQVRYHAMWGLADISGYIDDRRRCAFPRRHDFHDSIGWYDRPIP